jgi:hypothetical protein
MLHSETRFTIVTVLGPAFFVKFRKHPEPAFLELDDASDGAARMRYRA